MRKYVGERKKTNSDDITTVRKKNEQNKKKLRTFRKVNDHFYMKEKQFFCLTYMKIVVTSFFFSLNQEFM